MKGFVLGTVFGVAIVFLSIFLLNNGSITSNVINSNQNQEVQKNDISIQNEVKKEEVSIKNQEVEKEVVKESNTQEFKTFRIYNPNNDSREAVLIISRNVEDVNENLPIIKVIYPLSLSDDYSELSNYLKTSKIESLILIGNEESDIRIATLLRRSSGISIVAKFARA